MKIALIFPGYDSQDPKMSKDLYEHYPVVKKYFKEASDHMKIDFKELCFSSNSELNQIKNAYLSIYVTSCALYALLAEHDIAISYVSGYDTGQYAALCAADAISFTQGLDLLNEYANEYTDLLAHNKYDIIKIYGLTETKLPEFLTKQSTIASYQSRVQHLVSGTLDGIADIRLKLRNASGVTLYDEGVGLGLNSELMNPVVEKFVPTLRKSTFHDLAIPVISNVNGALITQGEVIKEEIIKLINSPLAWDKVVDALSDADLVIGMGPQANLLNLAIEKYPSKFIRSIANAADVEKIQKLLGILS